ncbi:MAG: tyrosine-type recombinase/integrase [Candidatus Thermoplasmatota archaeon]|nr:tyrosine-type recombinase/integrase [Candidatus Thermoplasmatota archaeon]
MSEKEFETTLSWMEIKPNVNRLKKSEDLLIKEELNKIIENAMNPRERALFSLMYDSGCRIGEILTLRIKDMAFDQFGAIIHFSGKTGERKVRIGEISYHTSENG